MDKEALRSVKYVQWWWDCPSCGDVHEEGDIEPDDTVECPSCGDTIFLESR